MRITGVLATALFVLGYAARDQAQTPVPTAPITMQQAVDLALARNPALLSAQQHLAAVKANEVTAGLRQNPTLTFLGQDVTLGENNPAGNPYSYAANVSRLFERGEKRRWRLDIANNTYAVTESQLHDQQRLLVLNVRQAFTTLLAAKEALAIAQENLDDYKKTVDLSQARLDAGDISRTDFERIDLQLAQFESDFDSAKLNLQQQSTQLQMLFGVDHPTTTTDTIGTIDPPAIPLTMAEAEQKAIAARPDLQAARQNVDVARANVNFAKANGTVDPTVAAEYERSGFQNTFGASVSIPLRIFDRNQGEKERTRYELTSSQFAVTAAQNQVISDVDQAYLAVQTALLQAQRYRSHYLDEAARVRDNLQFSYRNGNSTLLDYLDALRAYRAIRLNSINADAQVWLAIHQLSFVTATDIIP
jgi:cobalt-zinc-cadmium efflux system outer membrane protein